MRVPFRFSSIVERMVWTFVQSFAGALIVTSTITVDEVRAMSLAGLAAGVSAMFTFLRALMVELRPDSISPTANVVQRVVWTFVAAVVGILPVTLTVDDLSLDTAEAVAKSALGAGAAALIALAKNLALEGAVAQAALRAGDPTDLP